MDNVRSVSRSRGQVVCKEIFTAKITGLLG